MREVRRSVHIAAPRDVVWDVLTDFAAYPEWSTFIRAVEGDAEEGARLRTRVHVPGDREREFRPTVMRADEGVELRWHGGLAWPGLIKGEHWFRLEKEEGSTRFDHGETFRGPLVRPFWKSLSGGIVAGFETFNRELKARVESRPPSPL